MTSRNGQAPAYPLDLVSPVRHVAAKLAKASPEALAALDLADSYNHPNPADLARVCSQEGCASDREATQWLINRAISELGTQVVSNPDGTVQLAAGKSLDDLRYKRKKIYAVIDNHGLFHDPFNPMSGVFSSNIRLGRGPDDMEELRASMQEFGWVPEFPALKDKRGVLLTGHRRMKLAEELGIEPEIKVLTDLGVGDEHDIRRIKISLASNLGFKPMTPSDRKAFAASLYLEGWTMAAIGEVLRVTQQTISNDLQGLQITGKPRRPKGGRPSAASKKLEENQLDAQVEPLMRQGMNKTQIGAALTNSKSGQSPKIAAAWARITARWEAEGQSEEPESEQEPETEPTPPTPRARPTVVTKVCTCPTCGNSHRVPV